MPIVVKIATVEAAISNDLHRSLHLVAGAQAGLHSPECPTEGRQSNQKHHERDTQIADSLQ